MSEHNPPDSVYYEDMIDLRALVKTLLKYKWIIVSVTLLAVLAAFLTSRYLLPPKYEAAAHIGITLPSFEVDLEPSINNPSPLDDYRLLTETTKALPELAEAVEVWLSVCEEMNLNCQGEGNEKPELEAALIGTSQLKLSVISENPEQAAEFANLWAEEVVTRWNLIYGIENIDLIRLEEEVTQSLKNWNTAQKMLEDYLPESKINVAEVQLNQAKGKLARYLEAIEDNEGIIRDAGSLDTRLGGQIQSSKLLIGDALSLVGLLQRTTGEVSGTQFQVTGTDIYGQEYTIAETRETLYDLISALENQNDTLEIQLTGLETEITQLALEREIEQYRIDLLEQERDRARSNYQALSGYLDETLIAEKHDGQAAYCVARAVVPLEGESKTLINTALAGMVGLMIAIGVVFFCEWWRVPQKDSEED